MGIFCSAGGFHKYEHYIGPDSFDGLEIECNRCVKCGKIYGSDEIISNEFVENERKRRKDILEKIIKETKEALADANHRI